MRCRMPEVWAAEMAASRSFFACLHALQRFRPFLGPYRGKKTLIAAGQMGFSHHSLCMIGDPESLTLWWQPGENTSLSDMMSLPQSGRGVAEAGKTLPPRLRFCEEPGRLNELFDVAKPVGTQGGDDCAWLISRGGPVRGVFAQFG
jgi:hypothetical protein